MLARAAEQLAAERLAAGPVSTAPGVSSTRGADDGLETTQARDSSWGSYDGSTAPHSQPAPAPQPAPPPDPAPRSPYPAPGPDWGAYDQYPPPQTTAEGRPWTIAGFVCGLAALLVAPIILGPMGITFGFIGHSKGDPRGRWVGIGSIVTMILGIAIGIVVLKAMRSR